MKIPAIVLPVFLFLLAVPASGQDMNGFRMPPETDLESILRVLPDSVADEIGQLPDSLRRERILAEAGKLKEKRMEFFADSLLATLPYALQAEISQLTGPERRIRIFREAGKQVAQQMQRGEVVSFSRGRVNRGKPVAWDGASPLHPDSVYSHTRDQEEAYIKAWLDANTPRFWTPEQQDKFRETFREDARRMNEVWRDSIQPLADSLKAEMEKKRKK